MVQAPRRQLAFSRPPPLDGESTPARDQDLRSRARRGGPPEWAASQGLQRTGLAGGAQLGHPAAGAAWSAVPAGRPGWAPGTRPYGPRRGGAERGDLGPETSRLAAWRTPAAPRNLPAGVRRRESTLGLASCCRLSILYHSLLAWNGETSCPAPPCGHRSGGRWPVDLARWGGRGSSTSYQAATRNQPVVGRRADSYLGLQLQELPGGGYHSPRAWNWETACSTPACAHRSGGQWPIDLAQGGGRLATRPPQAATRNQHLGGRRADPDQDLELQQLAASSYHSARGCHAGPEGAQGAGTERQARGDSLGAPGAYDYPPIFYGVFFHFSKIGAP